MASTVPTKSKSLHNIALPPLNLNGGTEPGISEKGKSKSVIKRLVKKHSKSHDRIEKLEKKPKVLGLDSDNNRNNDMESRSKILIKIPASMLSSGKIKVKEEKKEDIIDDEEDQPLAKTWNFRPRKVKKESLNGDGGGGGIGLKPGGGSGSVVHEKIDQMQVGNLEDGSRVRAKSRMNVVEKEKKVKFLATLTRQEIEEDIYSFTGSRASRKPRKRARVIQKHLDKVFPGQWLGSITHDSYKVIDHS